MNSFQSVTHLLRIKGRYYSCSHNFDILFLLFPININCIGNKTVGNLQNAIFLAPGSLPAQVYLRLISLTYNTPLEAGARNLHTTNYIHT